MQIKYDKYMRNIINISLFLSLILLWLSIVIGWRLVECACVCKFILISVAQDGMGKAPKHPSPFPIPPTPPLHPQQPLHTTTKCQARSRFAPWVLPKGKAGLVG